MLPKVFESNLMKTTMNKYAREFKHNKHKQRIITIKNLTSINL